MSSWWKKSLSVAAAACVIAGLGTPALAAPGLGETGNGVVPAVAAAAIPSTAPAPLEELANVTKTDLATHQDGLYRHYRIPALVVTNDGTLISAYDGRKTVNDLPAHIDTVVRISKDQGATWSPQVVARGGAYPEGYGDPSLGYNPDTNRVFLFYSGSKKTGFTAGATGTADIPTVVQQWVSYSDDNGVTWTHDNITAQVKNPAWAGGFAASGMATFIATGPYAGRLVQQYVVRSPSAQAVSAWTDDNGATWQHGTPVPGAGDENKTAATSTGDLILNNRAGDLRKRAYSTDGGATWGPQTEDPALIDATSNGSLTRVFPALPASDPKSRWMISTNNFDRDIRMNTAVRLSCDNGTTWPVSKILELGSSGYSTAAMVDEQTVGVLYERHGYADITFAAFPLAELTELCAPLTIAANISLPVGATTTVPVTITNQGSELLPAGEVKLDGGRYVAGAAPVPAVAPGAQSVVQVPVVTSADSAVQTQEVQASYTAGGESSQLLVRMATVAGAAPGSERVVYEHTTPLSFDGSSLTTLPTADLNALKDLDNGSISVTFTSNNTAATLPQTLFAATQKGVDDHGLLLTVNNGRNPYYEIRAARPNYLANQSPAATRNVMDGAEHTVTLTAANGTTKYFVDGTEISSKPGQHFFQSLPNLDTVTIGGVHFKTAANPAPTDQWKFQGTVQRVRITTAAAAAPVPAPSLKVEAVLDVFNYAAPPGLGLHDKGSYMLRLSNDGNVPLSNLAATSNIDVAGCFSGTLAPGAQQFCRAKKHTFNAADVAAGSFTPQLTVTATAAGQPFTASATTVPVLLQAPFELPAAPAALPTRPADCVAAPVRPVQATASTEESLALHGSEDTPASNAIDGNVATFWSSGWSKGTSEFPNSLSVDLGADTLLCGMNYTARQNSSNGAIGDFRVYVSADGQAWGSPVAGGTFVTGNAQQSAYFSTPVTGRYVKLVAYNDIGTAGTETTTVAEFSLIKADPDYAAPTGTPALIPEPNSVVSGSGPAFGLTKNTPIVTDAATTELGDYLAALLAPATGFTPSVRQEPSPLYPPITLAADGPESLGPQGYTLSVQGTGVRITGHTAEGVFNGVQTFRQLLPVQISAATVQAGAWTVAPVDIADKPRWEFRGAMLDVARRYYPVADVKRYLDYMAEYKLNAFHFHLTEDQGWRIAIDAYPALTGVGASVQSGIPAGTVDNGVAGPWFYSKAEYQEIVEYAAERFIEVIPEIDGPGHAGAAMSAVPNLNCNNVAILPWTNYNRGPNFCLKDAEHLENVKTFLTAVLADVAAQNQTSEYIHVGGDESAGLTHAQFTEYTSIVNKIVSDNGKKVIAWNSWADGEGLPAGGVLQNYAQESGDAAELVENVAHAVAAGNQLIMSPADRTYVDMKYDASTIYGLKWVNGQFVNLARSYQWEPTTAVPKIGGGKLALTDAQILGVEVALWADATNHHGDILWTPDKQFHAPRTYMDHMMFPRFPAVAELAWSAQKDRQNDPALFEEFTARLVNRAQGWDAAQIGYNRATDVAWKAQGAPALPAAATLTVSDVSATLGFDAEGAPVFTATGTLDGVSGAVVATLNGTATALTANGEFTLSAPARAGSNSFELTATDGNGTPVILPQHRSAQLGTVAAARTEAGWRLTGTGFPSGERLALTLHSEPLALGEVTADDAGAFALDVAIPAGAPAGAHQIRALGAGSAGAVAVEVEVAPTVPATPEPTDTPTEQPSEQPTTQPTGEPTTQPTTEPTGEPTTEPTEQPTAAPTGAPTGAPTPNPSDTPSSAPSQEQPTPGASPSVPPSAGPSQAPSGTPSTVPAGDDPAAPGDGASSSAPAPGNGPAQSPPAGSGGLAHSGANVAVLGGLGLVALLAGVLLGVRRARGSRHA